MSSDHGQHMAPPPPTLKRDPATVLSGWSLPDPPVCPECGKTASPAVHNTGDGWAIGWECDPCGPDHFCWDDYGDGENVVGEVITWPFVEDYATGSDWQALGFEVV